MQQVPNHTLIETWKLLDAEREVIKILRAELEAAKAEIELERNRRYEGNRISSEEHRAELAAANAEIERLKSRAWGY